MQPNDAVLYALIQKLQVTDPVLKDLLRKVVAQVQILNAEVFEPSTVVEEVDDTPTSEEVLPPLNFQYELVSTGIRLTWERQGASSILFEIRKGTTWDTGSRQLVTSTTSAVLEGQPFGNHTYFIRSQGIDGTYSETSESVVVVIPEIGGIALSGQIIDNFVLLSWNTPTSAFRIDYYKITKNGGEIGRQTGTFFTVFESVGGTFTYGVQAIDVFGNESSVYTADILLNQPPDYVLEAQESSSLTGTRTDVLLDPSTPSLFANIDETETWSDYAANGYTSLQDEIDDGHIYFLQPTLSSGEYEEVTDFGAVFDSVIVNVDWSYIELAPSMQVECFLSSSIDNVTYSSEVSGTTMYVPSLRYLKVRIEFTALT